MPYNPDAVPGRKAPEASTTGPESSSQALRFRATVYRGERAYEVSRAGTVLGHVVRRREQRSSLAGRPLKPGYSWYGYHRGTPVQRILAGASNRAQAVQRLLAHIASQGQ